MNTERLVSLVVAAHNHERFIRPALLSLIAQTHPRLELIVIDDGSTDATLAEARLLLGDLENRFVRVEVRSQSNEGPGAAIARGLEWTHGEFVFLLDSDDVALPEAIEVLLPYLADPEVALAVGDNQYIDADGHPTAVTRDGRTLSTFLATYTTSRSDFLIDRDFGSYASLIEGNYVPNGWLLRKESVQAVGGYSPHFMLDDWSVLVRLARRHRIAYAGRVLAQYRIHPGNTVLVHHDRLRVDTARILLEEFEYCRTHGLQAHWHAHARRIFSQLTWEAVRDAGSEAVADIAKGSIGAIWADLSSDRPEFLPERAPAELIKPASTAAAVPPPGALGQRIELYALCRNDAQMLPFFFRHYDSIVQRYVIFDDGSSDGSLSILEAHPRVEVRRFEWHHPDSFVLSELEHYDRSWKESRGKADWVIVSDIDEHLFHPALSHYLKQCLEAGVTVVPAVGFEMVCDEFPSPEEHLSASRTSGIPSAEMSKLAIFMPGAIEEMHFTPGGHRSAPTGRVVAPAVDEVRLLHYKLLGASYAYSRQHSLSARLGAADLERGWGSHWCVSQAELEDQLDRERSQRVMVLDLPVDTFHRDLVWWKDFGRLSVSVRDDLSRVEGHLAQRESDVAQLDAQRVQLQSSVVRLQAEVSTIQSTFSWRAVHGLWRLTAMLAPRGSRRERLWAACVALVNRKSFPSKSAASSRGAARPGAISGRHSSTDPPDPATFVPPLWSPPPALAARIGEVEIIVCVHNALDVVRECLEAVVQHSVAPYRLTVVDDGSDSPTEAFLRQFATARQAILIRHQSAVGYTRAANAALKRTTARWVVLLNSDTVVSSGWIDRLVSCAQSSPKIGLVGPLSNAASWQSIPCVEMSAGGDWEENAVPNNLSANAFAGVLAADSGRFYPRASFLNGFCLLVTRAVLATVGVFDEQNFAAGYGEENDYCLRARAAGFELAVADDVYVYHHQSRSYTHDRRLQLYREAADRLHGKHGQRNVSEGVERMRHDRVLAGIRGRSLAIAERAEIACEGRRRWQGNRVVFLLPLDAAGGGVKVVLQEAEAMRRMNVDASVLNLQQYRLGFEIIREGYDVPCRYIDRPEELGPILGEYDAVVATMNTTVDWFDPSVDSSDRAVRAYYVQDFEPWFYDAGSPEYKRAMSSYTRRHDLRLLTKTDWNRATVQANTGADCLVVGPSVDIDRCRPRPRRDADWPERPIRIAAMIRPSSPRRQAGFTLDVLQRAHRILGADVEFVVFGCDNNDPTLRAATREFPLSSAGILNRREEVAALLNEVDIFLDLSAFQAMGLTALEAMACGAAVVAPANGGASAFARPGLNAIIADTRSVDECVRHVVELARNADLRTRLQQNGMMDAAAWFPERAAFRFLHGLFGE